VEQSKKLKDNYLWTTGVGIGYRNVNNDPLSDYLSLPSDKSLSSNNILFNIEVGTELYKRVRLGLITGALLTTSRENLGTTYSPFQLNAGFYLGYNMVVRDKMKISINYQYVGELRTITARSSVSNATLLGALTNRNSTTASAEFTAHQPFMRFEFLTKTMTNHNNISTTTLGVDLGYSFSSFKGWSDDSFNTISGPNLDNNGMFFRLSALQTIKLTRKK